MVKLSPRVINLVQADETQFTLAHGDAQWLKSERKPNETLALLADDNRRLSEEALLALDEPPLAEYFTGCQQRFRFFAVQFVDCKGRFRDARPPTLFAG